MHASIKYSAAIVIGLVVGAVATVIFSQPSIPRHWFTLALRNPASGATKGSSVMAGDRVPVSYDGDELFESDIPDVSVKSIMGRAKFIAHASAVDGRCPVGYVVTIVTDPLDKAKLPDKYKKGRVIQAKRGPITVLPLDQATYEVEFTFCLLDHDGFELMAVSSKTHNVESGHTTELQSQTEPSVPEKMASLTDSIVVHMLVKKCLTASKEE